MSAPGYTATMRAANERRTSDACAQMEARARRAILILGSHFDAHTDQQVRTRWHAMIRARVEHSGQSLAQIAYALHLTKDAYAAGLRRALDHADDVARGAGIPDTRGQVK